MAIHPRMLTLHHQLTPIRHHLPQHTRHRQQPTLTKRLQPQLIRLQRRPQQPITRHQRPLIRLQRRPQQPLTMHQLLFQLTHHQQHTTRLQHRIVTIAVHLIRAIQQVRPRVKGDQ
jgi:hypothetical protein